MATSYPGGLDSFPARSNGTAIDATHVGNLQDSVAAVETELGVNPKGSAASVAARIAAIEAGVGGIPPTASGYYYWFYSPGQTTTLSTTAGLLYLMPLYMPRSTPIASAIYEITTAAASSTVTVGFYNDSSGLPATLQASTAAVSSTTTGVKEATVSYSVPAGWSWLGMLPLGGAPTWRICATDPYSAPSAALPTAGGGASRLGLTGQTGLPSTLPSTLASFATGSASNPRVGFKVA